MVDDAEEMPVMPDFPEEDSDADLPAPPPTDQSHGTGLPIDPATGLPEGCPVEPLGIFGDSCFYLDVLGQLREVKDKEHSRLKIQSLFSAKMHYLEMAWPVVRKNGQVDGWRAQDADRQLVAAAGRCGIWNSQEKVRDRGAWRDEDGGLVMHFGQRILSRGDWFRPGMIDGLVYPAHEELPVPEKPTAERNAAASVAAGELHSLLDTWNWRRPEIDAILLLGWLAAGKIGGALKWRPLVWITGGTSTGKSTLQEVMKSFYNKGMIWVTDPTPAYIHQKLGHSSLPILIDEIESEEDNRRNNMMIKLARQASSGGRIGRGGSDHKAVDFTVQSCFGFSSILIPPLLPQDRTRIAVLEMGELEDTSGVEIDHETLRTAGLLVTGRLIAMWDKIPEFLAVHQAALKEVGHNARGRDQYGTLLGLADLLLNDTPNPKLAEQWAACVSAEALAEWADDVPDHERCKRHLLTHAAESYRSGTRMSVAQVVRDAAMLFVAEDRADEESIHKALAVIGLKIVHHEAVGYLAVANQNAGLEALFRDSHWAARVGGGGGWVQALRRIEGAMPSPGPIHIGITTRATFIPLETILSAKDWARVNKSAAYLGWTANEQA